MKASKIAPYKFNFKVGNSVIDKREAQRGIIVRIINPEEKFPIVEVKWFNHESTEEVHPKRLKLEVINSKELEK
jgi:hypothetical protein